MLIVQAFRRAFDFSGRSSRAEYWQFLAAWFVAILCTLVIDVTLFGLGDLPPLTLLLIIICIVPTYAVTMRRLHDRDRTGWWVAIIWGLNFAAGFARAFEHEVQFTAIGPIASVVKFAILLIQLAVAGFLVVQMCLPGTPGNNRFGPPHCDDVGDLSLSDVGSRAAAVVAKISQGDPLTQIERLSKLHREGALSEAEFADRKAELLKRL